MRLHSAFSFFLFDYQWKDTPLHCLILIPVSRYPTCSSQVVEVDVKVEEPGEKNVHNNAFYAEETLLRSELQAMRDCNPLTARHWIVRQFFDFLELLGR